MKRYHGDLIIAFLAFQHAEQMGMSTLSHAISYLSTLALAFVFIGRGIFNWVSER